MNILATNIVISSVIIPTPAEDTQFKTRKTIRIDPTIFHTLPEYNLENKYGCTNRGNNIPKITPHKVFYKTTHMLVLAL